MSTLSIASPGVQINEVDQSLIARPLGATDVLAIGFANQGPTNDFVDVSSISEFENVFGAPSNAAERYLYYTASQILQSSPANLKIVRLPYGPNFGDSPTNSYSVLAYPVITGDGLNYDTTISDADVTTYSLQEPVSIVLTDDEYFQLLQNNITWNTTPGQPITDFASLGNAGLVVVNKSKSSVNSFFEGYYLVIADNSNFNPSSNYDSVKDIKTVTGIQVGNTSQNLTTIPSARLNFKLEQDAQNFGGISMSKAVEQFPTGYDFSTAAFRDSLAVILFSVKATQYNQDTISLNYNIVEGYTGSLFYKRTQNNRNGGTSKSFFLDTVVNTNSRNLMVFTNPNISTSGDWIKDDGKILKSVRINDAAKAAYASGVYTSYTDKSTKDIGSISDKLDVVLSKLDNTNDEINVDVIAEAGLATIAAGADARYYSINDPTQAKIYDDTYNVNLDGLLGTTPDTVASGTTYQSWANVIQKFYTFAHENRKDHVFISDPLRWIFVKGENAKTSASNGFVFSDQILWPLKNSYASFHSSYLVTYGNWIKTYDKYSDKQVWIPASGYAAAVFAQTAQQSYPWIAPAGFNRGILNNVTDIAVNANQKQRDWLYKANINPISFFTGDGFVIYGQKTLLTQPSAFDRINVRRLFLTLEKETQALLKYFVFEPNTFATRNRLKGALVSIFDQAKLNQGLYDYLLVCDETNNTPDVIDNNELRISIYIQPVRAAEFILADFIATRTGINFSELVG